MKKSEGEKYFQAKALPFVAAKGLFGHAEREPVGRERDSFEKAFQRKLSFTLFYKFIKKNNFFFNQKVPEYSCLCETCGNACLMAKDL